MDYKKILEGVVDIINTAEKSDIGFANICTYIGEKCPELAESEDEKIRKELIDIVTKSPITFAFEDKGKVLAWLEKQGEQKPQRIISAEAKEALYDKPACAWSEEDEKMMNSFLHKVEVCNLLTNKENVWIINKLKFLNPQSKQQWSEEDERMYKAISIALSLKDAKGYLRTWFTTQEEADNWLISLKDRYTWKPSEEQMKQLGWIAEQNKDNMIGKELISLYQDLKKLREE